MNAESASQIQRHLRLIYGEQADAILPRLLQLADSFEAQFAPPVGPLWTQADVTLITYGDQVAEDETPTLETLNRFITEYGLQACFSIVHVLPFCPYSSDDGFSVIDFRQVDPQLGNWDHLQKLGESVDLMYDLVLNHISQHSDWFQGYLHGDTRYAGWFHEVDPATDLTAVTRPRSHPLLTPFATAAGERHLWTTFSADQIDLNYADPDLLLEMVDVLLMYIARGARVIRLDAVAFLWKEIGTTCLHLERTHEVVKLFRAVLNAVAPHVILLTETNVPHAENISYFGNGDEAHMVYNFSLPPLLFDAYVNEDAGPLASWLSGLAAPRAGTTWFNFTASHDGIGVRPLEGLVDDDRFQRLIAATRQRGGEVSMRQLPSGELSPYELNISWRDAMRRPGHDGSLDVARMLGSQALMLALQGVPAPYFHSLVGTPNDTQGMQESGHARRINRKKYAFDELRDALANDPEQAAIFAGYRTMLAIRRNQPAFHPDGAQAVIPLDDPGLVAFLRTSVDGTQRIVVAANFSDNQRSLPDGLLGEFRLRRELIEDRPVGQGPLLLQPCQVAWWEAG